MTTAAYTSRVKVERVDGEEQRATIARVLAIHADACPMARTIGACVQISTRVALNTG